MMKNFVSVLCVFFIVGCVRSDSYLAAYKLSQNEKLDAAVIHKVDNHIDRDYDTNQYPYSPNVGQVTDYGPPAPQYGAPSYPPSPNPVYGPPSTSSQPPAPVYGPPAPAPPPPPPQPQVIYGPPAPPPPIYGAPSSVQVFYGMPHALNSFWEKLKFKLDVFTVGKILLKLVLFKKFVSWVAVICLLLFLPSLKNKFESTSTTELRSFKITDKLGTEEIDRLYNTIYKALDSSVFNIDKIQDEKHEYRSR